MTSEKLENCPFCGGHGKFIRREIGIRGTNGHDWWHSIQCGGCHAAVGYDDNRYRDKDDVIKAWNTRASTPCNCQKMRVILEQALTDDTGDKYNDYDTLYYAIEQALAESPPMEEV